MDIGKLLKNVHSLNEYISTTQEASEKCKSSKIQLNMSTVLALKKIRSLEIEYFNKCEENGIACTIFERMLCLPPSKIWGVLSKELVNLLQYWLDALRKHLVRHNSQWWTFSKLLLRFVKEIRQKDPALPNILVEHTTECLLDLATNSRPSATQRHEILHCFNMYCSESSREIRFAMRNKFSQYFTKLSTYMASCGHLPTQYSIMETLLRWLLPRQDRSLRLASAAKWFPSTLYKECDVDIFLERPWVNFFQDARDLLNAHNGRQDLITSVVCKTLTIGKVVIISGTERQDSWLDLNCGSKCMSVLLDPRVLESFGSTNHKSFETLLVTYENTQTAELHKEELQLVLSVRTVAPPCVMPSCLSLGDDVSCDVTAVVTSRCDVKRLDNALTKIFEDKYQVSFDINKELELSPLKQAEQSTQKPNSEEDARFSHPVELKRRKHSGYIVKPRQPLACMSPSTASTSSLAQLHEKLSALPRYKYDKEPVSVCALPELSIVTEVSEADDRQSLNTTLKYKPYGVCHKNLNKIESRKSQSDPETSRKNRKGRRLSPVIDEDTTSCLLVATIGSADDSVINDTVERLSKSKDYNADNLVDLLVKEALQATDKGKGDSGINTGDTKTLDPNGNSETIENTPNVDDVKLNKPQKVCKVVSSTSDESNTEAVETLCYVNTRRKTKKEVPGAAAIPCFDEQVVEEFFSQHFTENKVSENIISPTLAKKINETSSETSDNFGENLNLIAGNLEEEIVAYDFNDAEILECLNSMIDKVCDDFDKCTKFLNKDQLVNDVDDPIEDNIPLRDIVKTIHDIETKNQKTVKKTDSKKKIKLKYKITPKKPKARAVKRKNKLELESTSKMSTIIEDKGESAAENNEINAPNEPQDTVETCDKKSLPNNLEGSITPQMRRKRKLYSPKDEQMAEDSSHIPQKDTAVELKIKKTPKSTAVCYKEIEKERQRYIRMPRTRRSKKTDSPSPRTKKMNDVFDKLKESANGEKVILAKTFEADVYNFSSDSDDDFKEKKVISKINSTTTVASVESTVSRRRRAVKRVDYTDNKSSDEKQGNTNKRKVNRRPRTKKKNSKNIAQTDLVDERMRKAEDVLNTSIIVEKAKSTGNEPNLVLELAPAMEVINEKSNEKSEGIQKKKGKKNKVDTSETKRPKRVFNTKPVVEVVKSIDDDRTESPLPGLLVEPVTISKDDGNELSATMVDKFKKFYAEGPDKYVNESNTTQNLLSDIEGPPTVDITEEIIQMEAQLHNKDNEHRPKEKVIKNKKSNSVKSKSFKKDKNDTTKVTDKKKVEVLNISEITDVKSERSIATIGITGHGDFEEAPPSPKLINETLEPRNLEVEDLDRSMKDYFDKLTKDMNESNNRDSSASNESNARRRNTKAKSNESVLSKSPVVSMKRLSPEDISRWLPSRRSSESDEDCYASAKSSKKDNTEENHTEYSDNSDINETVRKSLRLMFKNIQTAKLESEPSKIDESEDSIISNASESSDKSWKVKTVRETASRDVDAKRGKSLASTSKNAESKYKNKSRIKLFEDLISQADKQSETSLSDDEDYMKEIIHTLSKKKAESISQSTDQKTRKNTTKSNSPSNHSRMSTSTKKDYSGRSLKRRLEEDRQDFKKRRVEVNNNLEWVSGSGVTVSSSVDDWFKRIEPETSRAEQFRSSLRHGVQNVMEKLDTTLVEIHRNTSRKFVHLFVDTQKHLCGLREQRHSLYTRVASDILRDVVKIIDDKFVDLDKRSQELDVDFMKQLKERASELIREDCKQKRTMMRLLKEDMQAEVDLLDSQGTST